MGLKCYVAELRCFENLIVLVRFGTVNVTEGGMGDFVQ